MPRTTTFYDRLIHDTLFSKVYARVSGRATRLCKFARVLVHIGKYTSNATVSNVTVSPGVLAREWGSLGLCGDHEMHPWIYYRVQYVHPSPPILMNEARHLLGYNIFALFENYFVIYELLAIIFRSHQGYWIYWVYKNFCFLWTESKGVFICSFLLHLLLSFARIWHSRCLNWKGNLNPF